MCYVPEAPAPGKATAHVAMATDPLSISQVLRAAGFGEEQANVLATQIAARRDDLVTGQDLALAFAERERKIDRLDSRIDHLDSRIDQMEPRLLLKLGAGMVAGFALMLTAMGISVAVLLNQLG